MVLFSFDSSFKLLVVFFIYLRSFPLVLKTALTLKGFPFVLIKTNMQLQPPLLHFHAYISLFSSLWTLLINSLVDIFCLPFSLFQDEKSSSSSYDNFKHVHVLLIHA